MIKLILSFTNLNHCSNHDLRLINVHHDEPEKGSESFSNLILYRLNESGKGNDNVYQFSFNSN